MLDSFGLLRFVATVILILITFAAPTLPKVLSGKRCGILGSREERSHSTCL